MSAVLHGRRKGQTRDAPPSATLGTANADQDTRFTNMENIRNVTVLSKGDWDRIAMQLNRRQIKQAHVQKMAEERDCLKNRSKDMVKDWGNTIKGQRQRKLEARKIRDQKEEEERKLVDIEEAKFMAEKRKGAIEKAKTQQYYQTDRVKGFHGALMLTEVLKEREAQIELNHLKAKANNSKDNEWFERGRREYEESIKLDQEAAERRQRATKQNASFQKSQITEHLKEHEAVVGEDNQEGKELKNLALQYEVEKERLEKIRREERKQLMEENNIQIADVHTLKGLQKQQEEEEDEECRTFAAAKRKMMKMRAAKEHSIHEEKQRHLEGIRTKLAAQMKQKEDDEDVRIHQAVEEKEAKRLLEDQAKEEKTMRLIREAGEHRFKQMGEQDQQRRLDHKEELEMLKIRQEADSIFMLNEEEKVTHRKENAVELSKFLLKQEDERKKGEDQLLDHELSLDKMNMELLGREENQFQEYANRVIEHCQKGGENVYPLIKAAQEGAGGGSGPIFPGKGGIRPSYMVCDMTGKQLPNYQKDSTDNVKDLIYGNRQTKKRLGFVW